MLAITGNLRNASALRQGIRLIGKDLNLTGTSSSFANGIRMAQTSNSLAAPITLKVVPAASTKLNESYAEKNERLNRELSPHLTIYKPQLTSLLSLTHRGTGAVLGLYVWSVGLSSLILGHDFTHFTTMLDGLELSAPTWKALKFVFVYPFTFHAANGIRHLLWDSGKFLKIKEVYSTGYAQLAVSVVLAGILAFL